MDARDCLAEIEPAAAIPYSEEWADRICRLAAEGEPLARICATKAMPSRRTVRAWLAAHESFRLHYRSARDDYAALMAREIIDIADGLDGEGVETADINRAKLRIDTRKWLMSRTAPHLYGDHVKADGEMAGTAGGIAALMAAINGATRSKG